MLPIRLQPLLTLLLIILVSASAADDQVPDVFPSRPLKTSIDAGIKKAMPDLLLKGPHVADFSIDFWRMIGDRNCTGSVSFLRNYYQGHEKIMSTVPLIKVSSPESAEIRFKMVSSLTLFSETFVNFLGTEGKVVSETSAGLVTADVLLNFTMIDETSVKIMPSCDVQVEGFDEVILTNVPAFLPEDDVREIELSAARSIQTATKPATRLYLDMLVTRVMRFDDNFRASLVSNIYEKRA